MSETEMPDGGSGGGGPGKGKADGVSGPPDAAAERAPDRANVQGRSAGGESGGGAYDNPHADKQPTGGGFMGHGGQTDIAYHGGGQAGEGGDAPNAATGSDSSNGEERGAAGWPAPEYDAHPVEGGGRTFGVVETSGIAQAEATGKVGTDAPDEHENPGAG